jgi:hypothetical protein
MTSSEHALRIGWDLKAYLYGESGNVREIIVSVVGTGRVYHVNDDQIIRAWPENVVERADIPLLLEAWTTTKTQFK